MQRGWLEGLTGGRAGIGYEAVRALPPGVDVRRRVEIDHDGTITLDHAREPASENGAVDRAPLKSEAERWLRDRARDLGVDLDVSVELAPAGEWPSERRVEVSTTTAGVEVRPSVQGASLDLTFRGGDAFDRFAALVAGLPDRPSRVSAFGHGPLSSALLPFERTKADVTSAMFDAEVMVDDAFVARIAAAPPATGNGNIAVETSLRCDDVEVAMTFQLESGKAHVEVWKKWGLSAAEQEKVEVMLGRKLALMFFV